MQPKAVVLWREIEPTASRAGCWPPHALLLAALVAAGCASSTGLYPVQGKVVFDDGKPLGGGTILFGLSADLTVISTGDIGADGSFALESTTGPGARPGEYQVLIQPPYAENRTTKKGLHPRYEKFETSALKRTVQGTDNFFEIKVERGP